MKKLNNITGTILFIVCIPLTGTVYFIESSYLSFKRWMHRNNLHRSGRVTNYNPYCDKW